MNRRSQKRSNPFYPIGLIRQLASLGKLEINEKARLTASRDFGWNRQDIIKAFKKLKVSDYYKTDPKYDNPKIMVDYYKSEDLLGEIVYTHFRIEDRAEGQYLIICSLKRTKS